MKKGWEIKRLPEIAEYFIGLTYAPKDVSNKGMVVLRSSNIQDDEIDLSDIVRVTKPVSSTLKVRKGDILMCSRNGSKRLVGKTAVIGDLPEQMTFGTFMTIVRGTHNPYLAWFFKSDAFRDQIGGGENPMINQITKYMLDAIRVPFPSLAEQQRIVGVLDEAFAGLAVAQANAAKNLQNARALFESHLQAVFSQREKGWVEITVKEIAAPFKGSIRTGPFGSQLLHSEFVDEGIAVLGIDNAVANEFRWGRSRFITEEKYRQLERYTVYPGDVLITIMGTCGRCAVVPDDIPTAINTKHICCITLDRQKCLPDYLHIYFLHAPQSQEFLAKYAKGAIMAGLNMGLIQQLPVQLPPLKVQRAVTDAASALSAETQRLSRIYELKQAQLATLKKSLLHQAFTGQL